MSKIYTLRNIIAFFSVLIFAACEKSGFTSSSTIEDVATISSEDESNSNMVVQKYKDKKTGQTVYLVENY